MIINGKHIVLRDWEMSDLPIYSKWLQPGQEWKRFDGPYYPSPSREEIPEIIEDQRNAIEFADWPVGFANMVGQRGHDATGAQIGLPRRSPFP